MATIKSFTDFSQSKVLAEILPLESADCFWDYDEMQKFHRISWFEDGYNKESQLILNKNNVCAWSLAALMDVLERGASFKTPQGWVCKAYAGLKVITSNYHNNPVDDCVDMIEKLNELKML